MSIIRQVTWDEFPKILGQQQFQRFVDGHSNGICVALFVTDWSFPSRLALKRIKKLNFDRSRCAVIDVDLVDSMQLVDHYEIKTVPYCIVFKEGQPLQHLNGFRIETLQEIFALLVPQHVKVSQTMAKRCEEGHCLSVVDRLPEEIYADGYVYCNKCRKIERCEKERFVGHCPQCDYDLCSECLNGE